MSAPFPQRREQRQPLRDTEPQTSAPQVTQEEITIAARRIAAQKTPGPDGIPNGAVIKAVQCRPDLFAQVYQQCISEHTFPKIGKMQRLVLIPKKR